MTTSKRIIALCIIFISAAAIFGLKMIAFYRNPDEDSYKRIMAYCKDTPSFKIKLCKAENTDDETVYFFVPDSNKQYRWKIPSGLNFYIDGNLCKNGDIIRGVDKEDQHLMAVEKDGAYVDVRYLVYRHADNMPAISITVDEDILDKIQDEGIPVTKITASIVITDGTSVSTYTCEFGGHGSSSWEREGKRSYEIEMAAPISLLGLEKCNKWDLISNNMDRSLVKDKIVYEAAKRTDYEYSVGCTYFNCYMDGIYQGLYLLTEKPDPDGGIVLFTDDLEAENRILCPAEIFKSCIKDKGTTEEERYYYIPKSPVNISGSYFLELDGWYDEPCSYFKTGRAEKPFFVMLRYPKIASEPEVDFIKGYVREMESALYSNGGIDAKTGLDFRDRIDMYSWSMSYLFMDFFGNQDTSGGSLFFYKKRDDPILYSGPVWDYDKSMTDNFYNSELQWNERADLYLWYERMDQFEDFHEEVVNDYKRELSPIMDEILTKELPIWMDQIYLSSRMDDIRWNRGDNYARNHAEDVQEWLTKRKELFDGIWIRGEESPYAINIY